MTEIIDSLERNIQKLINKQENLINENKMLREQVIICRENSNIQATQIKSLNTELESLKLINALLGSNENKRETKLKINILIREIDSCIAQLSQ